jgi:hypothetical protein
MFLQVAALVVLAVSGLAAVPAASARTHATHARRSACKGQSARTRARRRRAQNRCVAPRRSHRTTLRPRVSDTTAPTAPSKLTATAGDQRVVLAWTASTDPDSGVAGYRIYRGGSQVAQTTGTTYSDTGLTNGFTYSYYIRAYDPSGNVSAASSTVSAVPTATGTGTTTTSCTTTVGTVSLWDTFAPGNWPTSCWRPYADSSPYNQPLPAPSSTPLDPNSANIVHYINSAYGSNGFSDVTASNTPADDTASNWDHPVYWAHSGDPVYTVSETEYPGDNNGASVLIPAGAQHALGSDGHLAVVQPDGTEEDFWQVQNANPLRSGGTLIASAGGSTNLGGSGCCTNSTAANQGLAAGLIRGQELQAGAINHALIVTIQCDNGGHVYPASGNGGACANTADAPAEGQRFQLNMTDSQVDALAVPAYRKIILKAMIHYGFYITDTGGSPWDLHFEPGIDYTSFGSSNPLVTYAKNAGLTTSGTYTFTMNDGVDWSKLQVVNVCYTQHTC